MEACCCSPRCGAKGSPPGPWCLRNQKSEKYISFGSVTLFHSFSERGVTSARPLMRPTFVLMWPMAVASRTGHQGGYRRQVPPQGRTTLFENLESKNQNCIKFSLACRHPNLHLFWAFDFCSSNTFSTPFLSRNQIHKESRAAQASRATAPDSPGLSTQTPASSFLHSFGGEVNRGAFSP